MVTKYFYYQSVTYSHQMNVEFIYVKSILYSENRGFPNGSVVKNPPANIGDTDLMPGLGRSPGEGNGHPFQYSCLENPTDRGTQQATVHEIPRVGHDLGTKPPQKKEQFFLTVECNQQMQEKRWRLKVNKVNNTVKDHCR